MQRKQIQGIYATNEDGSYKLADTQAVYDNVVSRVTGGVALMQRYKQETPAIKPQSTPTYGM